MKKYTKRKRLEIDLRPITPGFRDMVFGMPKFTDVLKGKSPCAVTHFLESQEDKETD